jgi:hypothetical protein
VILVPVLPAGNTDKGHHRQDRQQGEDKRGVAQGRGIKRCSQEKQDSHAGGPEKLHGSKPVFCTGPPENPDKTDEHGQKQKAGHGKKKRVHPHLRIFSQHTEFNIFMLPELT